MSEGGRRWMFWLKQGPIQALSGLNHCRPTLVRVTFLHSALILMLVSSRSPSQARPGIMFTSFSVSLSSVKSAHKINQAGNIFPFFYRVKNKGTDRLYFLYQI